MIQTSILIQVICAVLAGAILTYLLTNGRRSRPTYSYMLCIGLLLFWHVAEILLLLSQNAAQEMTALKIKFLPVVYIGASWLYFCLSTVNSRLADNKAVIAILFSVPAIFYLFLLTNEYHHLFYIDVIFKTRLHRGPVFWLHTAESYFCIFSGTVYLFINLTKKLGRTSRENIWLLLAVALPMGANILMLTEVIPNRGLDITSQVMLITLICFGVVVYQKRFLNLIPVAARHFIENMSDGIIIIDHENIVVGMNEAVNHLLPGLQLGIYDPAAKLYRYIKKNSAGNNTLILKSLEGSNHPKTAKGNLKILQSDINLEVRILKGFHQTSFGRMIVMEDRSEEQQLLNEIKNKNILMTKANERLILSNSMLTEANVRLEQFSATVEELAVSRERNRMGREVHDTVGHTLTLIITLAEKVKAGLTEPQRELGDILDTSIKLSRQALNDIRSCLKGLSLESFKKTDLAQWMNYLALNNASSGTKVQYSIADDLPVLDATRVMAVYRICQESVTNAIRHGQAQTVNIIVKHQHHCLRLYIFNDGKGCVEIVKGYGLTGMEERIQKIGGSITFGSDGEKGFNIIVELPISV